MARYDFDLVVIGAGSGGVRAARMAAAYGARVAIAEASRVGGTCVMRGCIPKKLLVLGSHFAEDFEDARGFGWTPGEARFDWPTLVRNKNRELDRLEQVYLRILRENGVKLLEGRARLADSHAVEVAGRSYTAANVLISTGSWPVLPDIPGAEHAITSNEALELPELPRRLAVVGGGYVAVEFAGIFNALGVEVTEIIRRGRVLRGFDEDVREALSEEMAKKGVVVRGDAEVRSIEKADGHYALRLACLREADPGDEVPEGASLPPSRGPLRRAKEGRRRQAGGETVEAERVMCATGRGPNTKGLGLEDAGVELDDKGAVRVDAYSRSSVPNVYAIGDATDRRNLTPVAIAEAIALAKTLFRNEPTAMDYANIPSAVFSQPPVATVGLTEAEARAKGPVDVYLSRFKPLKHALSGRDETTMMKLVVDGVSDRVLGCHMVGADAPEIVQGLAVAIRAGATKAAFDSTVGIHPTAAEEFVTMRERRPGQDSP
jgi:glutathione reductase (NADPH)